MRRELHLLWLHCPDTDSETRIVRLGGSASPVVVAEQKRDGFEEFLRKKGVPFKLVNHGGVLVLGPDAASADTVAAHPKRFTGVFSVDVLAADATVRMRHWMERGLTGMRLFTFGSTMSEQASWLDDAKSYPAWSYAAERGLSICMQMSADGLPQLTHMIERFPKVNIILDHMARPVPALGKQRMSLRDRLVISEAGEFLDGLDMAVAHEIAPHDCISRCKGRSSQRS